MTTLHIYIALFTATTLYAGLLAWLKHLWEPDLTWLEVVLGVAICLLAPYFDQRNNGPLTSELYEQRVWLAFVVGGLPIVIWRVSASVRAWGRITQRIGKNHDGNTTDRATSVAAERGAEPEANDRAGG
jgi:hypothetical protein